MASQQQQQQQHPSISIACEFCQHSFPSRNLFFRHLRDTTTPCGGANAASRMDEAPSQLHKAERQRAYQERQSRNRRDYYKATQQQPTQHCVWIGDLPLPWTRKTKQHQRLRALLRAYYTEAVPWILHVQRKAYKKDNVYLGYVVVAVRDAQDCTDLIAALDGTVCRVEDVFKAREVSSNADFRSFVEDASTNQPFTLRARLYVQKKDENAEALEPTTTARKQQGTTLDSPDPPILHQLRPLSTQSLVQFTKWVKGCKDDAAESPTSIMISHPDALQAAVEAVAAYGDPRSFLVCQPRRTIPEDLRDRLVHLLSTLRWPVPNHRSRVITERYMVLWSHIMDTEFWELRQACRELMEWNAQHNNSSSVFEYSAIAVTKNFVGSPHIDERDTTVQYAVSLGDFTTGGELCVQGCADNSHGSEYPNAVYVVHTHNRLACVDGRHVHWVRPWTGGDRYSLIFYSTHAQQATPIHPLGVEMKDIEILSDDTREADE